MWHLIYSCWKNVFVFACLYIIVNAFNIEELKFVNYEVDISEIPVKKEETTHPTVQVTSKSGQEFQCLLPQLSEEDASEKEVVNEKDTDVLELLKPMKTTCISKGKDWWTYEFCFGHYIKQFHVEDGQIIGQVITLGLYESDYDWNNETDQDKFKHAKQRYHSQYYTNGTKCDLTGQPRNAEVRIYCEEDAGDHIHRVDEPGTCSYIITVHTSRLCSHPLLKPLPSNKAHLITCHPLLNDEQYSNYLQKLQEEKALAEEKRSQWLTNQQERLLVMKNENLSPVDEEKLLADEKNQWLTNQQKKLLLMKNENLSPVEDNSESISSSDPKTVNSVKKNQEKVRAFLLQQYDKEMEKLKSSLPPEKFISVKNDIQKQFDKILDEAKQDFDSDLSEEAKDVSLSKLTSVLNMLLKKLDKAEKEVVKATKGLDKAQSAISDIENIDSEENTNEEKEEDDLEISENNEILEDSLKVTSIDQSQTAVLDDDKLQVRIRRLDRKSSDANGKLHEMDFEQRKKLEQAVKEKLEKAGLDTGGRRIEVKIITAGYYDNEDGKDFQTLTDEETDQFHNMIMALLTGQQEAVQEMKRHKKLEDNYKFIWDESEDVDNQED